MTGRPGRPVRPDLKYENHATGDDFDLVGSLRIPQPTLTEAELLPENKCAVIVPEPFLFRNMWENKGLHPFERDVPPPTSGAGSKRPRQEQAGSNSHSSTEKDLEASLVSTPVYEYQVMSRTAVCQKRLVSTVLDMKAALAVLTVPVLDVHQMSPSV